MLHGAHACVAVGSGCAEPSAPPRRFIVVGLRRATSHQVGTPGSALITDLQPDTVEGMTKLVRGSRPRGAARSSRYPRFVQVENMTTIVEVRGYRVGIVAWTDLMNNPFEHVNNLGKVIIDQVC
jgi:hypothetical protein